VLKVAVVGLAFFSQLVLTRLMGAEQYGVYVYALTWLTTFGLLGKLGTEGTLTRFVAAYIAEEKWGLLKGLMRFGYGAVFLVNITLAALLFEVLASGLVELKASVSSVFQTALLLLPVYGLLSVTQSILYGLKRAWLAQLLECLLRVLLIAAVGAVYFRTGALSARVAILSSLGSAVLVLALAIFWTHGSRSKAPVDGATELQLNYWLRVSLPLCVTGLLKLLLDQGSVLIIGLMTTDTVQVAAYAVAMRVSELTAFGLMAVNLNVAPSISELFVTRSRTRLESLLTLAAYGIFAYTLVASLFLYFLGQPLLRWFGPDFTLAYSPMVILVAGQIVNALTGSVGVLLVMSGNQAFVACAMALNAALSLALNFVLVPEYGAKGAAISTATGLAVLNLTNLAYVVIKLKLNPTVFKVPAFIRS
jgi:O-antigen/teichoic acid export membrane protein